MSRKVSENTKKTNNYNARDNIFLMIFIWWGGE